MLILSVLCPIIKPIPTKRLSGSAMVNAFAENVQAAINADMNAHIAKPIVMEEVIRTIFRNLNP